MTQPLSFIINAPCTCIEAHTALQRLIEEALPQDQPRTLIFMGAAAPMASPQPSTLNTPMASSQPSSQITQPATAAASAAPADPAAAPASLAFAPAAAAQLDALAAGYQQLAARRGTTLLVCGRAAREYGLDETTVAPGISLTGYMELLALMNSKEHKVIVW